MGTLTGTIEYTSENVCNCERGTLSSSQPIPSLQHMASGKSNLSCFRSLLYNAQGPTLITLPLA